jgi:hypothetical protein
MDLLKRHNREEQDRTRPPGRPPVADAERDAAVAGANDPTPVVPPPPPSEHRFVGGAARTEPPVEASGADGDPLHRTTGQMPATTARDATEPHGQPAVEAERPSRRLFGPRPAAPGTDTDMDTDRDHDGIPDRREADERRHVRSRDREVVDEVVIRRWSVADALVTLIGAGMAAVGVLGLIRAEVNETWYEPVVQVARADHTPLLAALEVAVGVLIALAGIARRRIIATLLGVGTAVAAAIAALETAEVGRELAIEDWWAWVLCGAGVAVALLALVPRKGRIERVTRTEPAPQRTTGRTRVA